MAISVFAYCDQRYQHATWQVVSGVGDAARLTSPPIFAADFNPVWWSGYDFIYLDLHGQPSSVYLYSGPEQRWAALRLETVRQSHLGGAVVFATSCYLPQTQFIPAFLGAGAGAVIAGEGENYGTRCETTGAQLLAMWVIREMNRGASVVEALDAAKNRLRWHPKRLLERQAVEDALQFRLFAQGEMIHGYAETQEQLPE